MMEEDSSVRLDAAATKISGTSPPKLDATEFEEISASQVPSVSELPDISHGTLQEYPVTMAFPGISPPAPLPDFAITHIDNATLTDIKSASPPSYETAVHENPIKPNPITAGEIPIPVVDDDDDDVKNESDNAAGLFGWFTSSDLVSKVVERTKSGIESVLTTVDPGMKEYLLSGGDIHIIIASASENKIGGFRDAFQSVFGHASVTGEESQSGLVAQPVGFDSAYRACLERIKNVKPTLNQTSYSAIAAVENCVVEMLPHQWFDIGCLVLHDSVNNIDLTTFTAPVPLPDRSIQELQSKSDKSSAGFSMTIGEVLQSLSLCSDRHEWHLQLTGVSRRTIISEAAKVLAHQYRSRVGYRIRSDSS